MQASAGHGGLPRRSIVPLPAPAYRSPLRASLRDRLRPNLDTASTRQGRRLSKKTGTLVRGVPNSGQNVLQPSIVIFGRLRLPSQKRPRAAGAPPVESDSRVGKTPRSPCLVQKHRDHRGGQGGAERDQGDLPAGHAAGDDRVAVAWTGGAADALDLFVPPAPTEHASGGHRPAPGGVGLLEEDGRRRRGLQLPRPLGRLGDLSDHLAHGLVLRFEGDIGLGYHANKQVVIVHDRQPPHLMLCHQVKRV